tara:strand:+ start:99 stop:560 length:462 start_codon:yes stop_codon:yes gene_type:complete
MGNMIGSFPFTWAGVRSPIFNNFLQEIEATGSHSVEYKHGFRTTEGNGLVRTPYSALGLNSANVASGPNFTAEGLTASPAQGRFGSQYNYNGGSSPSGMLTNEDRAQLTGETAVLTSGSITIGSNAFIGPYYQLYSAYNASEAITSIGKLTAF